jgi:hypothetical protein
MAIARKRPRRQRRKGHESPKIEGVAWFFPNSDSVVTWHSVPLRRNGFNPADVTVAARGSPPSMLLAQTNQQVAVISKQMTDTQTLLTESNRLVVESTRQVGLSIKNVVESNAKMDVSNTNMAKSNNNMMITNENMTKTLAKIDESNRNVARSNELMTEMIRTMQRIPGLKP